MVWCAVWTTTQISCGRPCSHERSYFSMGIAGAPESTRELVDQLPPDARAVFGRRLAVLVSVLTGVDDVSLDDGFDVVAAQVRREPDLLWLTHAVLAASLPTDEQMTAALARARLRGAWAAMAPVATYLAKTERLRDVDVVRGAVLCDVHYTSSSNYLSGIQRVVRGDRVPMARHPARHVRRLGRPPRAAPPA